MLPHKKNLDVAERMSFNRIPDVISDAASNPYTGIDASTRKLMPNLVLGMNINK